MAQKEGNPVLSIDKSRSEQPLAVLNRLFYEGYMVSRSIYVAAQLGVADVLKDGPMDTQQIAEAVGADPDALYRLLRSLASVGVFAEVKQSHFALTPLAACLQDVPGSLRGYVTLYGSDLLRHPVDNLLYSVQTGMPAFERVWGMPLYSYLKQHSEITAAFDAGMASISSLDISDVLAAYDFSGISTIADVGGGNGDFVTAILRAHRAMKGVLFERASVIEDARARIVAAGLSERVDLISGDFFDTLPGGADAYMLKSVIHNWDDARSIEILRNCRRVMPEKGRLIVIDPVILPGDQPALSKFVDLMMLVMTEGGRERTEQEFHNLFEASGFKLTRLIPTESRVSVVEGIPL